jgi:hypothetical protein
MKKFPHEERSRPSFSETESCASNGGEENFESSPEQDRADPAPLGPRIAPSTRLPARSEFAHTRRIHLWED